MSDLFALSRAVRERRVRLGYTQTMVVARGGPSNRTYRMIETATAAGPVTDLTLGRLDGALRWPAGTALNVYSGALGPDDAAGMELAPDGALSGPEDAPHPPRPASRYRASAPLSRALTELQGLVEPTEAERAATGAVWHHLAAVMAERDTREE